DGPRSLKSIAEDKGLSAHYLEQIAAPLRNAGLIRSIRGAYGGYTLMRQPDEITSGDIIRVLEGPITPVEGIEQEEAAQKALRSEEHTSELQSRFDLVCRLLLEKKKHLNNYPLCALYILNIID